MTEGLGACADDDCNVRLKGLAADDAAAAADLDGLDAAVRMAGLAFISAALGTAGAFDVAFEVTFGAAKDLTPGAASAVPPPF